MSKDVFRLVAAISFGPYVSTVIITFAEIINAFILFFLARTLGRAYVENKLSFKFQGLSARLDKLNLFWLLMLRAVPLVPFRFLDLGMGLTGVTFRKYLLVVVLASPLRILWVQYVLAGVGKSILDNPLIVREFIYAHKNFYLLSLAYFLLVITVFLKIKRKE